MEEVQDTCPCCAQPARTRYLRIGAADGYWLTAHREGAHVMLKHPNLASLRLTKPDVEILIAWLEAAR